MREKTRFVRGYTGVDKVTGSLSVPVYHGVTFAHPALGENTGFAYAREDSPTRQELERIMALLEHGVKAWAFSSGMAAISTAIKTFEVGSHIIVSEDLYGGTYRLFSNVYTQYGYEFEYVDTSDLNAIKAAVKVNTKGIYVETPSNPMMNVADLEAIGAYAKEIGALLVVDNTFLTPYFQKPLLLGADIVIHSGTKYIGGHNDVMAGFLVVKEESLIEKVSFFQMSEGGTLGPQDSWLLIRSIKTLSVRLDRQQENALKIAAFLKNHKGVSKVYYVGDEDHKDYEITKKQTTGFGGMISFRVKDRETVKRILSQVEIITFAESLGGTESLITYPMEQTHGSIPEKIRKHLGVDETLLRLSVGIEDVEDLIEELDRVLN